MPRQVSVTPSCIAAMNRGGSRGDPEHVARAPVALVSSSMIRVRRAVTSPYSAATKKPFSRIEHCDGDELQERRHAPLPGRSY